MEEKCTCIATWVTISVERSLPGMSSWGGTVKPARWEGARFTLSIHEAMPCREGAALFSPPAHAPAVHHNTLSPEWGASCWLCHCRTKEELGNKQELSAGSADHHMVNPAEHLQENTVMCVCSSHMPIFQTSRNTKTVFFFNNSISHIAISTFTSEQ